MPNVAPSTPTKYQRHRGQKHTSKLVPKKPEPELHDHIVHNWATCPFHHVNSTCPAFKGFCIRKIQLITLKCIACDSPKYVNCPYRRLIHWLCNDPAPFHSI